MLYIVGIAVMNTWAVDVRIQSITETKITSNYDPAVGTEPCRNSGSISILCFQEKVFYFIKNKNLYIRFFRLFYMFCAHNLSSFVYDVGS
jgi:hypothetical protein